MDENRGKGSVLVVDDLPQNLALASSILRKAGYDPRPVASGAEALELVAAEAPDLILLDISMPGMDGYETCRRLKADERTRDIPVIFLSAAQVEAEDAVRGFREGAVDYVTKPVIDSLLVARVETHVRLRRNASELAARNASLAAAVETRDRLLHILGHDLRNSISSIPGAIDILAKGWRTMDPAEVQEFLDAIGETSRRGVDLLSSTLAWARTETEQGSAPMRKEEVSIAEALAQAAASCTETAERKGIELKVEVLGRPEPLRLDSFALATILRNLAGNACKFSPRGGRVAIRARALDGGVEFSVEDSGPGIDSAQASGLHGNFVRSRLGTEGELGSGVGLVISGSLAKRLGGRIEVGRSEWEGARMSFVVPYGA
ncbi:MAG TPA: hybrid sensor histidine kinase/response regulator [Rectinemataceae bacterium]|nr:hybrid sensor histidine kinase/response regulator [Rectinemataceae bacterium]